MNAQSTAISDIPLHQLQLSPRNARKTGGADVDGLAASIAAHGLLQNLTVTNRCDGDAYQVIAGGRRLAAMQLLARDGKLSEDFPVPCLVITDDVATEASTAENTLREAMHPADQYDAFKAMIDSGRSIPDVAAHFGVAEVVVKQRLKLANVNPDLVQLYRNDEMDLDQLQALAITDNHEAQRQAWFTAQYDWERSPHKLREHITRSEISSKEAIAIFVGLQAYEDAGGQVRRDLFSEHAWLIDRTLLDRLAMDKLAIAAKVECDAGWSWAEPRLQLDYDEQAEFPMTVREQDLELSQPSPEVAARIAALDARLQEIDELTDTEEDLPERCALNDEEDRLLQEREAIEAGITAIWPEEIKNVAGVLVSIDPWGKPCYYRGRLKPGQKLDKTTGDVTGKPKIGSDDAPKPKKPKLSQDMHQRLDIHRAAACRQHLVERPQLAVQLLTANLVQQLFYNGGGTFEINATNVHRNTGNAIASKFKGITDCDGRRVLDDSIKGIVTPKKVADVLPWIQTLDATQLQQVQALVAAVTFENHRDRKLAGLADMLEVDMAEWWQPDADRYLSLVPKALILEAITEAKGKDAATALASLKKDALVAEAAKQLAGTGWLPKPLRGSGYALTAQPGGKAKPAKKKAAAKKKPAKKAAAKQTQPRL